MAQQTFEEIVAAVKQAESRGKRYAADGKTLTTSPKGALGEMQVMPKTITDPGFGVAPAKDKSPDEIARVGRDYLQAMLGKYGDTEKALVAYNWGPGATDKWLASGAKPEALPAETRTYVQRVKGLLGKDVPRETMAKKDREPLPPSLPPMAEATSTRAPAATVAMASGKSLPDIKSLPASYQAAFALAALADAQDEEDDRVYNENKSTETEEFFANYKPVNRLASLDLEVKPVMMAKGGDVSAEQERLTPQQIERIAAQGPTERKDEPFFDAASRTYVDVLTGRRTPITEKDFTAKEQMAMMDAVRRSQARGGKGRVDYEDYPDSNTVGPGYVDIRNTLGGFQYKQGPDGATIISDRYDFHGPRVAEYEKMGTGEKVLKSAKNALTEFVTKGFSPRDLAGELGRAYVGSKGPEVNIRIPVNRAEGSPEEGERLTPQQIERIAAQETAEREAASNAAFIAQKSGIGRKAGPVSQALQSGQGQIEFLKGMTNIPQNIMGAPMDISNMIANVYGGGVEKPFMGSEYLKEKSRAAGLGFKPSTDPTLASFYGAGDLGSNLVNPAGVTRAGVQAAGKTGEAARMLAQDFQQYNQNLAVPGASYAMKPKGGHYYVWPESSRPTLALNPDGTLVNKVIPEKSQVDAYLDKVAAQVTGGMNRYNVPLSDWVKSKVGRYIRSDFATEQDQMVQAAEQGKKLHFTSPKAFEEGAPIIDPVLEIMRKTEGFPKEGFAKTGQGKLVEDIVDSSVWPATLDNTPSDYIPSSIRGLKDTDPNMRIYEFPDAVFEENLKMTNLVTEMDKMMTEKTIKLWNQEVPVPKEYQLDADTLKGLTPAQASNRVAMKEEWLLKKEPEVAGQALAKDPQLVSHRYDNGSKWISPDDLSENDMHRQMVNSIGCRGGWCTDKDSFALDYGSGDNRLHILLDKGFQPRAQLTMSNRQGSLSEFLAVKVAEDPNYNTDLFENLQNARASGNQQAVYDAVDAFTRLPEYLDWSRKNNIKQISEIKGQFNKEDLTNQPYLKEVQDFVKRQGPELQSVENLDGIGMTDISSHIYPNRAFKAISTPGKKGMKDVYEEAIKINGNSAYIEDDPAIINSVIEKAVKNVFTPKPNAARQIQMNFFEPPAEKAYGGMIERQPTDNRRYL